MKITKQDLVQLIKEELDTMLAEGYEERMRDIARNKAHYDSGAADYLRGGSGWGGGVVDTRDFVRGAKQALKKAGPMLGAAAGGAAAYGALDAMAAERAKLKGPAVPQASWEDAIKQDRERRGESSPTEIAGETIGGLFGGSEEISGGDMTPELRARYGLKEKIQYELTKLLNEQPRPGSLAAQALQRRKDRASQGIPLSPTEKRVDTKLVGRGGGRPSGQSAAEEERRVRGATDTSGIRTGGAGMDSAAFNKNPAAGVNVGARTRPGASTQSFADQVKKVGAYKGPENVRTGGAGMESAAFTKPTKPATAATKSAAPKSRKAKSKDAYFKTLSRMSDRGTIKPWQQKKLDKYKASQAPAKPAAKPATAKITPTPTMGQATGMSFLDKPAEDEAMAAATGMDFLKETAISEQIETIVNDILSRLNQ